TGRPPFRAATVLETLEQVRTKEPVAVRQLNAAVPRDLETICLKCLQKEPARRYASAQALADDLRRLLEKRPSLARPVGPAGRGAKWARRNPVIALSLTGAVLVLVVGTVVSTYFWRDAEVAKAGLEMTNGQLVQSNDDLGKANAVLEKTLARSLLRPLGLHS